MHINRKVKKNVCKSNIYTQTKKMLINSGIFQIEKLLDSSKKDFVDLMFHYLSYVANIYDEKNNCKLLIRE